jgi:rubrerythrin
MIRTEVDREMKKLVAKLWRCDITVNHSWERHRAEGETYWECRLCGIRHFGAEPPEGNAGVFGSPN